MGEPALNLTAPVRVNIVCFCQPQPCGGAAAVKALNVEIVLPVQEQGIAALSDCGFRRKPAGYSDVKPATVPT